MAVTARLYVHHASGLVGRLDRVGAAMQFTYEPGWLQRGFSISQSLPLQAEPHGERAHFFFANLLPEAQVRRQLCQRLGISADNDFELLKAIGGECAGALVISAVEQPLSPPSRARYRELDAKQLTRLVATQGLATVSGRAGVRLSLAGAQDKLPVVLDEGRLLLPLDDGPSTHILKFPNRDFAQLPANEVLLTLIARQLDLPTVDARLWPVGRTELCLVARYDRRRGADGAIERVHQEDLCQALGFAPITKYQSEGGPSFRQCFEVVRQASRAPLRDARSLLRWLAFDVMAFNADGHAKNLSLLYTEEDGVRLAPFYDLVCTRAYPRLARELAMGVGGAFDPTLVLRRHWQALAVELEVGGGFVLELVRELSERFAEATAAAAREFREQYGEKGALQLVLPKVRRQARRIAAQAR